MASTPSIETLTRENTELYQEVLLYRTEVRELEEMVDALKKKIRTLLGHIPAGALPAPTLFSDPRCIPGADRLPRGAYGSFYPEENDGAASAAAAGGGPPVVRSMSSHGIVPSLGPSSAHDLYDALAAARPALAPSTSEVRPCTGNRISEPSDENRLVVSEIPSLHRTYANLSPTGHWRYWKQVPGGYVWDPKWNEEGDE